VAVLARDLGLLQAGAGVRGEFEERVAGVLRAVKNSPKPVILFVDEAHTLIGAGGPAGGSDAANLLKPALARGEVRTIAATTWAVQAVFEKARPWPPRPGHPPEGAGPGMAVRSRGGGAKCRAPRGAHRRRGGARRGALSVRH
jgi:hypothetical protein